MRVMIDSPIWVALQEDEDLLEHFRYTCNDNELDVIFSIGNFLDLIRCDDQDELSYVIDKFTDEYLAPLQLDLEGEYRYSSSPLILSTVDVEWYDHCKRATRDLDDLETLQALFRDADFDEGPISSRISQFVNEYREIENADLDERMDIPEDTSKKVAIKKIRTFPGYTKRRDDGMIVLDDANIPKKRYIVGMSMIYISETRHEPEAADYRDAMIWSQAIISGCDVLWTERQWEYEHPIISQILERLDRKDLAIANGLNEIGNTTG